MVGMADPFFSHLLCIELGIPAVEPWIAVDDLEVVVIDYPDLVGIRNIGEAHGLSVPFQFAMEAGGAGQAYGQDTHIHHLGEGT